MSKWVCRYCVMTKGIRGSELDDWPEYDDKDAHIRHIEQVHHIPVYRAGETEEQTLERFHQENPDASGLNCRCPDCKVKVN